MKKIILLASLLMTQVTFCFIVNQPLLENIAQHQKAFVNLQNNIPSIRLNKWVIDLGDTIATHYDYYCKTEDAHSSLQDYKKIHELLSNKMLASALGDGFILGILAALANKTCKQETLNKKILSLIVLSTIGMIIYQHRSVGKVPYYDPDLKRHENLFGTGSAIFSVILALVGASASYLGTSYLLERISNAYSART